MLKPILLISLIFFVGCTKTAPKVVPVLLPEKPKLNLSVDPLVMRDVKMLVITPATISKLEESKVLYCTPESGYANMSINLKSMANHIEILHDVLKQYKDYYEGN